MTNLSLWKVPGERVWAPSSTESVANLVLLSIHDYHMTKNSFFILDEIADV
jgi:hypothetical protein